MKSLTVRLPEELIARLEAESRERRMSRSDLVRERLERDGGEAPAPSVHVIADLIGSVDGLPADVSSRRKAYLKRTGYGGKRSR